LRIPRFLFGIHVPTAGCDCDIVFRGELCAQAARHSTFEPVGVVRLRSPPRKGGREAGEEEGRRRGAGAKGKGERRKLIQQW